ncbi:MAG: DUF2812 domain-containing protein [Pseudomonadota bacterium]
MSGKTTTIYKFFWADQDVEQEQWLREQARKGLHLEHVNIFCGWTFIQGAPADVVYRVDFSTKASNSDYNRLFEDAGWEHAAEVTGWQYWRKAATDGRSPEIFTDNESKIAKLQQVLWGLALCMLPGFIMLTTVNKQSMAEELSAPFLYTLIVVFAVGIPVTGYGAMRLLKRIRSLRNA